MLRLAMTRNSRTVAAAVTRRMTTLTRQHRSPTTTTTHVSTAITTARSLQSRGSSSCSRIRMLQRGFACSASVKSVNAWLYPASYVQALSSPSSSSLQRPTVVVLAQSTTPSSSLALSWQAVLAQQVRHLWQLLKDLFVLTARSAEIVTRLSPLVLLAPAAVAVPYGGVADAAWHYFTTQMQALGPVFVKLCQWAATRPDIFPPFVCARLSCLHDRGLPHAWRYTHAMLQQAFGEDYEQQGLQVDGSAVIGCGSAAQVYRGTLTTTTTATTTTAKENNRATSTTTTTRPVAVKVLHPHFQYMVDRDLTFIQTIANWIHAIPLDVIKMLNLPRVAGNFGTLLQAQSDLRTEAAHLERFRRNFYGTNDTSSKEETISAISFPRPMPGWTAQQVLVEDLVDHAQPIATFLHDDSAAGLAIRKQLAGPLLRAFLKMIFVDNFTHGDLHPGNVFVQTQQVPVDNVDGGTSSGFGTWWTAWLPSAWANTSTDKSTNESPSDNNSPVKMRTKHTIVFLDAGIATTLSPTDQRNLIDLFRAVILNKGEEAGRLMVERARYERCSQTPGGVQAFSQGIGALVAEFHDNRKAGLTLGAVRIGSLLSRVLDLCRIHGVEIDPAMASIVVSTLVLEGLGRSLEPSLDLMRFAIPFVLGGGRV